MKTRNIILYISVLIILLSSLAVAQGKEEKATKPLFFVNTNSVSSFISGGNFGLTVLKQIAEQAGFAFDHGLHPEINDDYLEGISVYYMPSRKDYLLDTEKAALKRFMKAGGVVIFCHYTWSTNESSFTKEFGIEYGSVILGDNYGTVPAASPLAGPYNVNRIRIGETLGISINNPAKAIPLAYTDSGKLIAAESTSSAIGSGRLFVLNTMRSMYDGTIAGYVEFEDNKNFIRNLFQHINGKFDLNVLNVKPKGTNLHSGDKFTCVAKIKNVGDKVSDSVKLYFYITDDGNLEVGQPPTTIKIVKKVNFAPLDPGKTRLVKTAAKIPNWLGAGSYILVAKVDPLGKSDDDNEDNNTRKAGKKLKIKED